MSQSLGNYVGIRDAPAEMFGKLMSIPDRVLGQFAALAADLDDSEIVTVIGAAAEGGPGAGKAKRAVARSTVALYHGDEAAAAAEASFDRQFKQGRAPEEVVEASIPNDAIDGETVFLPRVLAELGLASSRSEARRLIEGSGVRVNGETLRTEEVALSELKGALLQVGKRRFVRLSE